MTSAPERAQHTVGTPARATATADGITSDADGTSVATPDSGNGSASTRDRILDISLELFTTQGYDKTSMREIAERLGFSKAAIYYHFEAKEDILLALHLRLHEFGREALDTLADEPASTASWAKLLDGLIDQMLQQRALFLFHERNQAAIESLHRDAHDTDHEDLQMRFREVLFNEALPVESRVRMSCAFGAVMGGLAFSGDVFSSVPSAELGGMMRRAVTALLTES